MSKNYGNYPDPKELIKKYGGDALRLYLMGSPVMHGEDILISEEQYRNQVRGTLLILWNVYNFFMSNAINDNWNTDNKDTQILNVLDKWILSLLNNLIKEVTFALEHYDSVTAIAKSNQFIDQLSTWYIRRSRERVGVMGEQADKNAFYHTTYIILTTVAKLLAPITPFITEEMYRNLTGEESIHLADWPVSADKQKDNVLETAMQSGMDVASLIHTKRKELNIKVRMPLREFHYTGPLPLLSEIISVVEREGNVEKLLYVGKTDTYTVDEAFDHAGSNNLNIEAGNARDIIRQIQQ